ncbi:DUF1345 domain-containing protein [Sphaerotilaceae bacterium SBD11-9]
MSAFARLLRARSHLLVAISVGMLVTFAWPGPPVTRMLVGWDVAVWLYLAQAYWVMSRADHQHVQRTSIAQSESAAAVLAIAIVAVVASMAAIAVEFSAARNGSTINALPHILFVVVTVVGAWLLLPTLFALSYAAFYHRKPPHHGLLFPSSGEADRPPHSPHYWDFLYFSFTIAVASQTADVTVTTTSMRRLVLLQSVLSFVFNTAILALAVNIGAGLI